MLRQKAPGKPHRTSKKHRVKRALTVGNAVVWPRGAEERYGISPPTRWRWEKSGRLPPRDVNLGGKTGWRPETLEAAEVAGMNA